MPDLAADESDDIMMFESPADSRKDQGLTLQVINAAPLNAYSSSRRRILHAIVPLTSSAHPLQTHSNVVKAAFAARGITSRAVMHLPRHLRTHALQPAVSLTDMAAAQRWRSLLGTAAPYVNVWLCT